ncbi:MAG: hypothetical protein ACT4PV_14790 [Planctomycetaceae bacterium]
MRSLKPHEIPRFVVALARLGIAGGDRYEARLRSNAGCSEVLQDLAIEGLVAATLAPTGFSVTMSDRPDLEASHGGAGFGIEVKHFRRRPEDDVDDARLRSTIRDTGMLTSYGDPSKHIAQVLAVLRSKARTLPVSRPAIVATYSSSEYQIEHPEVLSARNAFETELAHGTAPTGPLNGILHLGSDLALDAASASAAVRKCVGYYELRHATPTLPEEVTSALRAVRRRWTLAELLDGA